MIAKQEIQDYLIRIYRRALEAGIIDNKGDYRAALGMSKTTLSSAMNGSEKNLTKNLYDKVKFWAQAHNIDDDQVEAEAAKPEPAPQPQPQAPAGIFLPAETLEMYTAMAHALENLSRLVGAPGVPPGAYPTPKNDYYPNK